MSCALWHALEVKRALADLLVWRPAAGAMHHKALRGHAVIWKYAVYLRHHGAIGTVSCARLIVAQAQPSVPMGEGRNSEDGAAPAAAAAGEAEAGDDAGAAAEDEEPELWVPGEYGATGSVLKKVTQWFCTGPLGVGQPLESGPE